MKKLMLTLAVVCTAAISQAATCSWASGKIKDVTDTQVGKDKVTAYLYAITVDQYTKYAAMDAEDLSLAIYNDFYKKGTAAVASKNSLGTGVATLQTTAVTTRETYAILYRDLVEHDEKSYVMGNVADYTWSGTGTAKVDNLAFYINGNTSGASTEWAAVPVPEPFSGALCLLGMGAIALRRKMKKAKAKKA